MKSGKESNQDITALSQSINTPKPTVGWFTGVKGADIRNQSGTPETA